MPQKGSGVKEPPVSSVTSGMKRDTSRIFTVLEEGEEGEPANYNNELATSQYESSIPPAIHDSPPPSNRRKQQETKQQERAVKAAIAATASSLTPSVCATPLKDVNRVLHDMAMLICSAPDEAESGDGKRESDRSDENERKASTGHEDNDDIPDVVKEALR